MEWLPAPDLDRFTSQSVRLEVAKSTAEFYGQRPRRFALLSFAGEVAQLPAGAKRVHVIRHGEGYHNVWRATEFDAGRRPFAKRSNLADVPSELFDPQLTEIGRAEAKAAQAKTQSLAPQLLITSPLRRAVQTLLIAFEHVVAQGGRCIAHELCREEIKGTPPGQPSIYDAHLPRETLAKEFPQVDFKSYVLPEEDGPEGALLRGDPMWWHVASPFGPASTGETDAALSERAWRFLCWLMSRPEQEIGIASHSIFLVALLHGALDPADGGTWGGLQLLRTGELRSLTIVESAAPRFATNIILSYGQALAGDGLLENQAFEGNHQGDQDQTIADDEQPVLKSAQKKLKPSAPDA